MEISQNSLPKTHVSSKIFIIICMIVSCLIGNALAYLMNIGALSFWHPLNDPPIHAVEILGGDRSSIWIKTNDEKIMTTYSDCLSGNNCPQWSETDHIPDNLKKRIHYFERSDTCKFTDYTHEVFYPPPGKVRECALAVDTLIPHVVNTTIYVLLENGSVWYWTTSRNSMGGLNSLYLVASFYCSVLGYIFALIILLVQMFSKKIFKQSTIPKD